MGALGAIAPTVFESVGASTHGFWWILPQMHQFSWENIWKYSKSLANIEIKHPQFEIPNKGPVLTSAIQLRGVSRKTHPATNQVVKL